jgi:methylated-DNA-[protein]-cysteine S-methyltransferase
VWEALLRIPYGEVKTYGEIAHEVGRPRAARAVGGACHANPIAIIVPCHRVVGAGGALTGFGGGLDVKERLLALERAEKQ